MARATKLEALIKRLIKEGVPARDLCDAVLREMPRLTEQQVMAALTGDVLGPAPRVKRIPTSSRTSAPFGTMVGAHLGEGRKTIALPARMPTTIAWETRAGMYRADETDRRGQWHTYDISRGGDGTYTARHEVDGAAALYQSFWSLEDAQSACEKSKAARSR